MMIKILLVIQNIEIIKRYYEKNIGYENIISHKIINEFIKVYNFSMFNKLKSIYNIDYLISYNYSIQYNIYNIINKKYLYGIYYNPSTIFQQERN